MRWFVLDSTSAPQDFAEIKTVCGAKSDFKSIGSRRMWRLNTAITEPALVARRIEEQLSRWRGSQLERHPPALANRYEVFRHDS